MKLSSKRKSRRLLLLGAGHAHLTVLKKFTMNPVSDLEVVLVNPSNEAYYSGMIPGMLSRRFQKEQLCFDVHSLCSEAVFLQDEAVGLDLQKKRVLLKERPPVSFDFLSINLGSKSGEAFSQAQRSLRCISTRPLQFLWKKIQFWDEHMREGNTIAVVGAGAAGVEISLALQARYPMAKVILLGKPPRVEQRVLKRFRLEMQLERVTSVLATENGFSIELENPKVLPLRVDFLFLATGPAAHDLLAKAPLQNTQGSFLVNENLQSVDHPWLFGAGDCISMQGFPWVQKSGVYSVRQGKVLAENLRRMMEGRSLDRYRPQKDFLSLLSDGRGGALARWYGLSHHSRWMGVLKDYIDLSFMEKFKAPAIPSEDPDCGGCGSKVSADVLCALTDRAAAKKSLPEISNTVGLTVEPTIAWGIAEREDIALLKFETTSLGLTVDQFKNMGLDPYLFGKIAAIHSASDLYAKNIAPEFALMNLQIPKFSSSLAKTWMEHLSAGVESIFAAEKIQVLGGQTLEGDDWSLGFTMLGRAGEKILRKNTLQAGDALWTTKPIGAGILLAAAMASEHLGDAYSDLVKSMAGSQRGDWELMQSLPVHACTDVTGFSLLGHLSEMLRGTNLGAEIKVSEVPVFSRTIDLHEMGYHSRMEELNRRSFPVIGILPSQHWLYDPQTCGGFLFALDDATSKQVERLAVEKNLAWKRIGQVTPEMGVILV